MPESRTGETYARGVVDAVTSRLSDVFPLVSANATDYDVGVWFRRVEFVPQAGGVPVWLTANTERSFVITAGDSYRWAAEFEPEFRDEQVDELVDEITRIAREGYVVVRRNRLLGAFSGTSTSRDESGALSTLIEDWQPWG